jgi:hypothetical protein
MTNTKRNSRIRNWEPCAYTAPAKSAERIKAFLRAGGRAEVRTYLTVTTIDGRTLLRFESVGAYLLRDEGEGYRMQRGNSSVYLMPGQLKISAPLA